MNLLVILIFAAAILAFIGTHLEQNRHAGQLRSVLLAQTWAVGLFTSLRLVHVWLVQSALILPTPFLLGTVADVAGALAATFGLAITHYLSTGTWRRRFYLLALVALLPDYGHYLAAALWLLIPLRVYETARSRSTGRSDSDEEAWIKVQTILTGTSAGGLWLVLATPISALGFEPMAIEPMGAIVSLLFLYAGLNARRDPENEFSFPATAALVKGGLVVILALSFLSPLFLSLRDFQILHHFLVPANVIAACAFIFILTLHFDSLGIRTFLVLFMIALLPNAFIALYGERLEIWTTTGLRLFSRIALVLACLFILKQYLRWGFEIIQNMVMIITALTSASIVFVVIYYIQPTLGTQGRGELELLGSAILLLDVVILASLPPVLIHYNFGTMKVTWAILSFGVFFEVYQDFLPATSERFEANIVALMAYALIALAFATLWRYSTAMMRSIEAMSLDTAEGGE